MVYNYESSTKFWISMFGIYVNFGIVTKILNFYENLNGNLNSNYESDFRDLQMISITSLILLTLTLTLPLQLPLQLPLTFM